MTRPTINSARVAAGLVPLIVATLLGAAVLSATVRAGVAHADGDPGVSAPVTLTVPSATPTATLSPTPTPSQAATGGGSGGGGTDATVGRSAGTSGAATSGGTDATSCAEPAAPTAAPQTAAPATADRDLYRAGETVHVSAGGFAAGEKVQVALLPASTAALTSATVAAGDDGTATAAVTLPPDAAVGHDTVTLTGWCSSTVASAAVLIAGAGPAADVGPFAAVPAWVWVVLAALVAAAIALTVVRWAGRRRGALARTTPTAPRPGDPR